MGLNYSSPFEFTETHYSPEHFTFTEYIES